MRKFVGIDLGAEDISDETTICKFHHLIEAHPFGNPILTGVYEHHREHWIKIDNGTFMDTTFINAPLSTKNYEGARDPDIHQIKEEQSVVFWHEGSCRSG